MVQALLDPRQNTALENPRIFNARFYCCHSLLVLIAGRVLSERQGIDEAVYNCWRVASQYPPRFEREGAFRSWLLRVLIDEALVIRQQGRTRMARVSPRGHKV